jgi:hypothetical protein
MFWVHHATLRPITDSVSQSMVTRGRFATQGLVSIASQLTWGAQCFMTFVMAGPLLPQKEFRLHRYHHPGNGHCHNRSIQSVQGRSKNELSTCACRQRLPRLGKGSSGGTSVALHPRHSFSWLRRGQGPAKRSIRRRRRWFTPRLSPSSVPWPSGSRATTWRQFSSSKQASTNCPNSSTDSKATCS